MSKVIDFINNGELVRNPKYNPKTKKGAKESPYLVSNTMSDDFAEGVNRMANKLRYTSRYSPREIEKFEEQDITVNNIDSEESLKRQRAENQSAFEQLGNMIIQGVANEAILGSFLSLSNIVDAVGQVFTDENDYTNPVSEYIEGIQNTIRDEFEIYQKDPNATFAFGDFGWWANNGVSAFSTLSMMLPTLGVTKTIGALGKINKIGKAYNASTRGLAKLTHKAMKGVGIKAPSVTRLDNSVKYINNLTTNAVLSRTMENYMEARGVWTETYESTKQELEEYTDQQWKDFYARNPELNGKTIDQIAKYIAGESADKTFVNDYAMLGQDILQFRGIGQLFSKVGKKLPTSRIRRSNKQAIENLRKKANANTRQPSASTDIPKGSFWKDRTDEFKEALKHPLSTIGTLQLSEAFEEGYQGIQTEKGKEVAKMYLDPNYIPRTIESYITNDKIWEQAFWGAVGGMVFQGAGKGLSAIQRQINAKKLKGKESDANILNTLTAEEKIMNKEIQDRAALNKDVVDKLTMLNDYISPDDYVEDPITGERLQDEGVDVHRKLTPEEAEIKKQQVIDDYFTNLAINAYEAGTYDLLKEYITSSEFKEYFREAGVQLTKSEEDFTNQAFAKMDKVRDIYAENLYNVLYNSEIESEYTAKIAAREFTREQLEIESFEDRINTIQNEINKNNVDISSVDKYRRQAIDKHVSKLLNEINQAQEEVNNNPDISEQAKNQYNKIYNDRKRGFLKFLNDNNPLSENNRQSIINIFNQSLGKDYQAERLSGDIQTILNDIEKLINESDKNIPEAPNNVKDLIDKQVALQDKKADLENIQPKSQRDYNDRIDLIAQQVDYLTMTRMSNAATQVEDWIKEQEDLDKAWQDILRNRVPKLKESLDMLKIGYFNTEDFSNSIRATIEEERQNRRQKEEEAKQVVVNGKQVSEEQAEAINNAVAEVSNNQQSNNDNSSTGEQTPRSGVSQTQTKQQSDDPNEIAVKAIIEDEDKITNKDLDDAVKLAKSFDPTINERAVGIASSKTFLLFRTSPNVFENALNKSSDSPEVKNIIETITQQLIEEGVSPEVAPHAAQRGVNMGMKQIVRALERRKDSKTETFRRLAEALATKQKVTIKSNDNNEVNAITTTIEDTEFDQIIKDFIEAYIQYKGITINKIKTKDHQGNTVIKNQKVIINLESLFKDIIEILSDDANKQMLDLDVQTAYHILYNIKDFINNSYNTNYVFTHKRSLNTLLNNPTDFYNAVYEASKRVEFIDNYMHIVPSRVNRGPDYEQVVNALQVGDDLEIVPVENRNHDIVSFAIKRKGIEIGFISNVVPDSDNNGYKIKLGPKGGINYHVRKVNNQIEANTDELFEAIFNNENELWDLFHKKNLYDLGYGYDLTKEEYERIYNSEVIQKAIKDGVIKLDPALITDVDKAKRIIYNLKNIIFYNPLAQTIEEYKDSYEQWKENIFNNYKNTHKIGTLAANGKKVIVKYAGQTGTNQGVKETSDTIIENTEKGVNELPFKSDQHAIIGIDSDKDGIVAINELTGEKQQITAPFLAGNMGFLIGGRGKTPIIAMFTSANKVAGKIKENLHKELVDILTGFQNKKYTFEEVRDKLGLLFNSANTKFPSIFYGYDVISSNNQIILSIGHNTSKFNVIIHKFKAGNSNELGTGITYNPAGDNSKTTSFINVNDKLINIIATEITNNTIYNRTFFTLNNIGNGNTTDNPYFFKKDNKFVIKLGDSEIVYDNFGDFVLQNNAFNTNQGVNKHGGFFNDVDKATSMYINVATLVVPDQIQSPVEGESIVGVANTIQTATLEKANSTERLLEKAAIPKSTIDLLTGKNVYGIPIVSGIYYYDKKDKTGNAKYNRDKKAVIFTKAGSNLANSSPTTLVRLLIHEQLHAHIDEHNLFDKENIIDDLFETYNKFIEAVEHDVNYGDRNSEHYSLAVNIKKWIEDNGFTFKDYFERIKAKQKDNYIELSEDEQRRVFAEEWLVESLSQSNIIKYLNQVEYTGEGVAVVTEDNEKKSIFQKIIDILLKIFNIKDSSIKNNTIFARQYEILNINDNNISNENEIKQDIKDNQVLFDKDVGEDITKESEIIEEDINEEDNEFGEDNYYSDIIEDEDYNTINDDSDELLSITSDITNIYTEEEINILNNAPRNSEGKLLAPNGKVSNLTEKQYAQVRTKAFKNWFGDWKNNPNEASKVVDENGEPLVVYHGTNANITSFSLEKAKHNIGIFLSKSKNVARSYIDWFTIDYYKKITNSKLDNFNIYESYDEYKNRTLEFEKDLPFSSLMSENAFIAKKAAIINFNEHIYNTFINLRNPLIVDAEKRKWNYILFKGEKHTTESLAIYAKKYGYDGVIVTNVIDNGLKNQNDIIAGNEISDEYIIFRPNQIKSATDNIGTFDPNNNDIRYSTTSNIEDINAIKDNDGNIIAETLDITRINNMADYLNSYSEQDKPLIAQMLRNGELKYACR